MSATLQRGGSQTWTTPPRCAPPCRPFQPIGSAHVHRRKQLHPARAGLGDAIRTGTGLGVLTGIALSSLPIISGEARRVNEGRLAEDGDTQGIRWAIMSILSFMPFLNPLVCATVGAGAFGTRRLVCESQRGSQRARLTPLPTQAWVFASMDDEDNASLYRAYAILYTVPYLTDGFKLDSFVLLSIAAGVAHVQVGYLSGAALPLLGRGRANYAYGMGGLGVYRWKGLSYWARGSPATRPNPTPDSSS